ncbi:MAG TPA: hypothetical protein VHP56_05700 [Solirubrobacterales bacterium]|jgi:hypothetical protein|nr:hypothetical protein [Solirubrobacterales bacterium]
MDILLGISTERAKSEHSMERSPKRRRLGGWGKAVVGLAILVVAFAVFASQQAGESGGGGPLNAIAQAAEKTQGEPGGRAIMRAVVTKPGSEPIAMRGEMVFDDEGLSRAVLTVQRPDSDRSVKMNLVGDGTVIYMSSSEFGSLPDDSKWMALDLTLGRDLDGSVPASPDARDELKVLEEVSGGVRKLGREDIRGVPTTHYRGTISLREQAERMREVDAEDLAARDEKEGSPSHVEAWVDADGLVRRMRIVQTQPQIEGKGTATMDMTMDFFDFGIEPQIDVPDSDEVFDATGLAEEELSKH